MHHGGRWLCSELQEDTDPVAEPQTPRRLLSTASSSSPSCAAGSLAAAGVGVRTSSGLVCPWSGQSALTCGLQGKKPLLNRRAQDTVPSYLPLLPPMTACTRCPMPCSLQQALTRVQGALQRPHASSTQPLSQIYRLSKLEGYFSDAIDDRIYELRCFAGPSAQEHAPGDAECCCPWPQLCSSGHTDLQRSPSLFS